MAETLKDKTIKGVTWSAIDNILFMGVSFVVSIVLARLLTPDDYGLIGIITIFTSVCQVLVNAGFANSLIRKKETTENDYNTAFVINLVLSILLYAFLFLFAPFIADFFNRNELKLLIQISSLGIIVSALALVQQTRLTKRLDFKSQTKITIVASLSSGVLGIILALLNFGVWALVVQHLSYQIIRTVYLWVVNKWIPKLCFSRMSFHNLFGFGWKIMLSSLLNTVWNELYQVVVGKFYSPATLGQYTRAKQFSTLFSNNLNTVVQRVTFPVLSNIQDDKERLVSAYRRIIKVTMFVTAISMITLGAISEPLIHCLIGLKWNEAANYLPLICLSSSLYPLHSINLNMLQVQGRSDLFLYLEVVKKAIAFGPLLIGAFIGVMPMLYTNLITTVIAFFLNSYYSGKILGYTSWKQLRDIAPSYGIAILIAMAIFFLKYIPLDCWLILFLQLIVGGLVFFVVCVITKCDEYKEIKSMISQYWGKLKKRD